MNRNTVLRRLARIAMAWALIVLAVGLAGCGESSEVKEIPAAARKSVLQKKVDDQRRPSKGSTRGR